MEIACLDLEGVLIPEVWINFAERTGIDALRATTRDIADYDRVYKRLIKVAPLYDVSSSFAMERIKYTTALPI